MAPALIAGLLRACRRKMLIDELAFQLIGKRLKGLKLLLPIGVLHAKGPLTQQS